MITRFAITSTLEILAVALLILGFALYEKRRSALSNASGEPRNAH